MEKKEFTAVAITYIGPKYKFGVDLDESISLEIINNTTCHAYSAMPAYDFKNIGSTAHLGPDILFKSLGIEDFDVPTFKLDLEDMRRKGINYPKDGISVTVLMGYNKNGIRNVIRMPGYITMAGTIYDTYEIDKYFDISMYNQITKLFEEEGK